MLLSVGLEDSVSKWQDKGNGITGGRRHIDGLERYTPDKSKLWLKKTLGNDESSYYFYCNYFVNKSGLGI